MSSVYEDYYKEIKDEYGNIVSIKTRCGDDFNFAYDVVRRYASMDPNKLALVHKSAAGEVTRLSFGDLERLSNKAAHVLRDMGVERGDAVMLLLKRRLEFWICILAIHKLGAVAVPTSHMVSAEDIHERVNIADCKIVIGVNSDGICEKIENAINETKARLLVVGDDYRSLPNLEFLMLQASDRLARVHTGVRDSMLYYFTSGTSGSPKAVIHDFSYPIAHIYTAKNWHGMRDGDLHLTVADSGWAKTAWGKLYGQWFIGAAILVYDYEQFYAADLLRLMEEQRVNTFCAPPTVYKYFVREDLDLYDLSALHAVTTAGEPMPAEVAEKFEQKTGLVVREGFGQTETALLICNPVYADPQETQKEGCIGFASPMYHVELVDEDLNPVEIGEEGEIVIVPDGSSIPIGVFRGYLGDKKLYRQAWRGGVYHTRDMAIRDDNGAFTFVGRNDDVIKSSGYRIGPSEVEDILMRHPAVFECAVTGYPSKNRGTLVKASIILKEGYEPGRELKNEITEFVKSRTAIYKYPRMIEFVEDLPRTSNGKISRARIRERDMSPLTVC
jgi:acetyl-CoA synthetase